MGGAGLMTQPPNNQEPTTINQEQIINPMKCPVCNDTALVMTERQGVEIDYCPKCRGVWLDRGELDKIIERSAPDQVPAAAAPPPVGQPMGGYPQSYYGGHQDHHGKHGQHGYYRKKSWLGELFD
jgi:Zn-finger nucleic acid-binding protein